MSNQEKMQINHLTDKLKHTMLKKLKLIRLLKNMFHIIRNKITVSINLHIMEQLHFSQKGYMMICGPMM